MSIVYLNGEYLPTEAACVPVLDRGFLFADGVYEVIPVYGGRLFRLLPHLARLDRSLADIRLANPYDEARWRDILQQIIDRNEGDDQSIYLQITRGVMARRDHRFPEHTEPTVLVMSIPLEPPARAELARGVAAITLPDPRWQHCHIKSIALLPNVMLRQAAEDASASEAILVRDNQVTEGSASNVFIVSGQRLLTPPTGAFLLPGITRDLVLELALANGIDAAEQAIDEDDLRAADEIWITSSTREIVPVIRLDDQPVGSGAAGPLWARMIDSYQDYKQALRAGTAT